jgi:hypothetical protein
MNGSPAAATAALSSWPMTIRLPALPTPEVAMISAMMLMTSAGDGRRRKRRLILSRMSSSPFSSQI